MSDDKKYSGYGYHGGGRKKLPPEQKKKYITISISGTADEIAQIKDKAKAEKKTVSRFVVESIL